MANTKARLLALRKKYHLGEFSLKRRTTKRRRLRKVRRITGRVRTMARRGRRSHRSSGGFGTRGIMGGLYHPKGIVGNALVGAGAATLLEKVVNVHPLQGVAVGFIVGGVGGAAGAYARDMLKGTNLLGTSSGSAGNY